MECTFSYKRIMLKLSGEALKGERCHGYEPAALKEVVARISQVRDKGVEVAVVVGAGNLWRGNMGTGMDHVRADYMGMLATAINALALQDACIRAGFDARVLSAISMPEVGEYYTRDTAVRHLEAGRAVIFAGGLGRPYFSTDTAGARPRSGQTPS